MSGKGSKARQMFINRRIYELRYDLVFGKTEEIKKKAKKRLIEMGVMK